MKIRELGLSAKIENAIRRGSHPINTVEELLEFIKKSRIGIDGLHYSYRNIGKKHLEDIKQALQKNNISYEFAPAQQNMHSDGGDSFDQIGFYLPE